jgi:3-isopropylmalate/(R)-2-methylmalate dehydratase small subunit
VAIDLAAQTIEGPGIEATFEIDSTAKERLLAGLDLIGATLRHEEPVAVFESNRPVWLPTLTI